MNQPNGLALRVLPVVKLEGEPDVTRAAVIMPIGTTPCGVVATPQGLGICILASAEPSGPMVPHKLAIMGEDNIMTPLLGEHFGEPLGVVKFGGTSGPAVAVVPILPWPALKADA